VWGVALMGWARRKWGREGGWRVLDPKVCCCCCWLESGMRGEMRR